MLNPKEGDKAVVENESRPAEDEVDSSHLRVHIHKKVSLHDLLRYASVWDRIMMATGVLATVGFCVCEPLALVVVGNIIDAFGVISVDKVRQLCLNFVWIALAALVCCTIQSYCLRTAADRILYRLEVAYFTAVLRRDVASYDTQESQAGLITSMANNVELVRQAIGQNFGLAIQTFGQFLAAISIAFVRTWQTSLIMVAFLPMIALGGHIFGSQSAKQAKQSSEGFAVTGALIEESFRSIRTVTALSLQKTLIRKLQDALTFAERDTWKALLLISFGMGLLTFGVQTSYSPAFYVGASVVVDSRKTAFSRHPLAQPPPDPRCVVGQVIPLECSTQPDQPSLTFLSPIDLCNCALCQCGCFFPSGEFDYNSCLSGGSVVVAFFAVLIAGLSLGMFFPNFQAVKVGVSAAAELLGVIDESPKEKAAKGRILDKSEVKGEIQFDQAVFSYPTRSGVRALDSTTLTIEMRKRTAICGASGSGKSSLVATLMRFYDLSSGSILLDGVDVAEIDIESLRSVIGLVSQEPTLFAGITIRENVRFGLPSAEDAQVEEACRLSGAHDFIMDFPQGYETILVGSAISGGQKQRLALARALIRDPQVLILDEATSALDNESERAVNRAIENLAHERANMTVLVIAHRLSTIRTCEKIIMLAGPGAKVLEVGSHDELMEAKGPYFEMTTASSNYHNLRDISKTSLASFDLVDIERPGSAGRLPMRSSVVPTHQQHQVAPREVDGVTTERKGETRKHVSFRRLFHFVYPERFMFVGGVVAAILHGASNPWIGYIFARVVPTMFYMNNSQVLETAALYAAIFVGIAVIKWAGVFFSTYIFGYISSQMTKRVRLATFTHLMSLEVGFFDEPGNNPGALSQLMANDAALVKGALSDKSNLIVTNISGLAFGLTLALTASWKLALVVLAMFPLIGLGLGVSQMVQAGLTRERNTQSVIAAQIFSESIHGFRTVSAFNLKERLVRLFGDALEDQGPQARRAALATGLASGFAQSVQFFSWAVMAYYGNVLVIAGEANFQQVIQAIITLVFTAIGVGNAVALAPDFSKGTSAAKSVFAVLDRPSKIDPFDGNGVRPSSVLGDVTFEAVNFTYPSRDDCAVLHDVSFRVPRGNVLALVGESGSGKSTVVQLLERFYNPSSGRILLDNRALEELNLMWLRSRIGFVSQEPVLFDDTIFNNIKFGLDPEAAEDLTEEEIANRIETAARDANALDFITQLPDGFNTRCGLKGSQLSGGQKQRIAISRALVRDPDILICDEATSALDEEGQRLVQDALDRLLDTRKRTMIVIAHRLSTVQRADMIVALRQGKILETGTYEELTQKEGGYFRGLLAQQSIVDDSSPPQQY